MNEIEATTSSDVTRARTARVLRAMAGMVAIVALAFGVAACGQLLTTAPEAADLFDAPIEGLTAAVKEQRSQQYASACNAANHHVRTGNLQKARTLLDVAAKDPALEKVVAELRRIIGGIF